MKTPWDPAALAAAGVGGIVSLADPVDEAAVQAAGIEHLVLYQPMVLLETEANQLHFLSYIRRVLPFVDRIIAARKSVIVHCHHGRDRTGAALACYLVAREKVTAIEAVDRLRTVNPQAMSAAGYAAAVFMFERLYSRNPSLFEAPA